MMNYATGAPVCLRGALVFLSLRLVLLAFPDKSMQKLKNRAQKKLWTHLAES